MTCNLFLHYLQYSVGPLLRLVKTRVTKFLPFQVTYISMKIVHFNYCNSFKLEIFYKANYKLSRMRLYHVTHFLGILYSTRHGPQVEPIFSYRYIFELKVFLVDWSCSININYLQYCSTFRYLFLNSDINVSQENYLNMHKKQNCESK